MSDKHVLITNFDGNPNVGMFGLATDKFCLVGRAVKEKDLRELEPVLGVPVLQVGLYGTELVGLFCTATSDSILLPDIVSAHELKELKSKLTKLGVTVSVIKTEHTALGNTILMNDRAGIISMAYDREAVEAIKRAFPKVKFEQFDLCGLPTPRSVGIVTNKGGLFSANLPDDEIKKVEKLFGFEIGLGTVNLGSPFVSAGIVANSNGFVMGRNSSGYELGRADESLGFLNSTV